MDLLETFKEELAQYLSGQSRHNLIKFQEGGDFDFSFILSLQIWSKFIKDLDIETYHDNILIYATNEPDSSETGAVDRLKSASISWTFMINDVSIKDQRCSFTMNRSNAYIKLLTEVTTNLYYGKRDKIEDETISLEIITDDDTSISSYRLQMCLKVLKNLVAYSKYVLVSDSTLAKHKLLVTSKSNLSAGHRKPNTNLLCGVVVDPLTRKLSTAKAQDYIRMRSQDMHLVSVHKYGVRVKDDDSFLDLMDKLGRYAATLDLLEVKQSSTAHLQPDPQQAFILYNSARMETLMEKFDKKVDEGYYGKPPDLTAIDTSLLKEEEEWELLKLIISFPDVIDRSIGNLALGKPSIHLIYKYLSTLVSTFSVYYRRVRLLTENRPQLMPVLHAKIHFLKCLQRIMNETLAIFCIEPIAFM